MDSFIEKILLIRPFLKKISEGNFFTKIFSWFLKILAVLALIGFLLVSFKLWEGVFSVFDIKVFFVCLFMEIIMIAMIFIIINILLIRSIEIDALPLSTDYTVIPIFVIVVKMLGEMLAVYFTLMGLGAGIAIWIVGSVPPLFPGMGQMGSGGGVAGGFIAVILGPIVGFLMLSVSYLIAEQIGVFVDIARNTKR